MQKRSAVSRGLYFFRVVIVAGFVGFFVPMAIDYLGATWFGIVGSPLNILVHLLVLGFIMKLLFIGQLPKKFEITAQTPVEFAGVRDKAALVRPAAAPLPDVPQPGAKPEKHEAEPQLDFQKLEAATAELVTLGFTLAIEGAVQTGRKSGPAMFERMFEHPSGAFVEIYQVFPVVGKALPLSASISSYYGEDWSVTDSTQKAHWLLWLWRRPHALTKGHDSGTSIRDLHASHLARRAKVEAGLGLPPNAHSVEQHLVAAADTIAWMRRALIRRSTLVALIQSKFFSPKNREWWGEYPKFAKT